MKPTDQQPNPELKRDLNPESLSEAIIDRYRLGMASPEDIATFHTWRTKHPHEAQRLDQLLEMLANPGIDITAQEIATGVEAVRRVILDETTRPAPYTRSRGIPSASALSQGTSVSRSDATRNVRGRIADFGTWTLRNVRWSSCTMLIATLAFVLVLCKTSNPTKTTRTYTTRAGQQATFTLSDSTRVTLAPRTTLRLAHFGAASRTVELDGQAYFEVARSIGVPFLVHTGDIATRVLGTSFLVRHYTGDKDIHVAVAEGKVDVTTISPGQRPLSSPLTLTAGYVGDVTDSTVIVNAVKDLTPETDWLHGQLVFRNASVRDVLRTLHEWYGFQFRCSDSAIVSMSVTIALDAQSSASALSTLEEFLNVYSTIAGDTVTLTSHPSQKKGMARTHAYDMWIPTREVGR